MAIPSVRPRSHDGRIFVYVALAVLAAQLACDMSSADMLDAEQHGCFSIPAPMAQTHDGTRVLAGGLTQSQWTAGPSLRAGVPSGSTSGRPGSQQTSMHAGAIAAKVINAMGAGAVAAVIQAALSAVGEPIVNRVLVRRMKIMEAIKDVSPKMMLNFFKTTLATNFLKFPLFEALNAFVQYLPISGPVRGIITGFVFTSATLPITNFRYRKSMELEVNWNTIYEAYFPTVIRDIVYGIARNWSTAALVLMRPEWTAQTPQLMFIVVIFGCLISAPFNEWRGYLLQSKGQELTFQEFFKPANFVRSTSLGALKQGLALALGYWCAPPVQQCVNNLWCKFR